MPVLTRNKINPGATNESKAPNITNTMNPIDKNKNFFLNMPVD